jgi:hypothetical protein
MQQHLVWMLFNAVLFYAMVPGVFLSLPQGGSTETKLLVHAILFAVVHRFLGCQLKKQMGY